METVIDLIADTVVTKEGKVYSLNGYLTKDADFPRRKRYLTDHTDKYDTGRRNKNNEAILMYPKCKKVSIVSPIFNTDQ
jgi:predicted nucleotidyltransferase